MSDSGFKPETIYYTDFYNLFEESIQFLHDQSHNMPSEDVLSWEVAVNPEDENQRLAHEIASCELLSHFVSGRLSNCQHGRYGDALFKGLSDWRIRITVRKRS